MEYSGFACKEFFVIQGKDIRFADKLYYSPAQQKYSLWTGDSKNGHFLSCICIFCHLPVYGSVWFLVKKAIRFWI
ncbi:hypothetical protein DPMN_062834 [Dreissena polymorpha]|uniref:Uncharacterized protein n=1 Tax=Dreissena polymorpha TaxID=45954 RepID=A0A9D4CA86_DREPO|nr:hypothetical protein DPMN_062834 [Dreissena polymorpha]